MNNPKKYEHFCVVRQEHLNQYGSLFGGCLLSTIDELAFVVCSQSYPGHNFLTRALQNVEFHAPAHLGDVLEIAGWIEQVGHTSCRVRVQVHICQSHNANRQLTFDGVVIMVCVGDDNVPVDID